MLLVAWNILFTLRQPTSESTRTRSLSTNRYTPPPPPQFSVDGTKLSSNSSRKASDINQPDKLERVPASTLEAGLPFLDDNGKELRAGVVPGKEPPPGGAGGGEAGAA